ncbi:hypothetical protein [Gymnodinialimonas sp. 57CJ19]|uniref:hypothetical protein n=1 Tax=Gymnodinialimonas sp. 57CJ19 TaxID=3138498 RepID=UPI0031344C35
MRDPVRDLAAALASDAPLKLWSVLVTCLGDVGRSSGAEVSGIVLSALVERLGLQPQAMRVALHRLKRDGWVESRRDGRVGYHSLSATGMKQVGEVENRVYGPGAGCEEWHLVGLPPDAPDGFALLPKGASAISIARSFGFVAGALEDVPEDWIVAKPSDRGLPDWVRAEVAEAGCEDAFAKLAELVSIIDALPESPLDRLALRVLVLHGWRRLALRSDPAAEAVLGAERAEIACRKRVHALLDQLGPVQDEWLQVLE